MALKLDTTSMPSLPFLKPKDSFAVDIGASSVKIAYLRPAGNRFTLVKYGVLPIAENSADLAPSDRRSISTTRLGEFLAREKILTKNVVSSVSGNQVIVRYVRFPKLGREELLKTIQFEAEPYIPFDIRDVFLGFHVIGDVVEEGQKKMETILVASKKEVVQAKLDILNDLNLRPIIIDLDAFAIKNAYELSIDPTIPETVMIINIGASTTNICIVENNVPRVVRDIFIAGNAYSKAIQRAVGCDYKTAEELKARYSILVTSEEKERTLAENHKEALQLSNAVTPVTKDLLGEIQRSLDFYISQNTERSVNRVLLCGGGAMLKGLDQYLHTELRIPVEIFNPAAKLVGGELVPDNVACQLATAIGLAARRENDAK